MWPIHHIRLARRPRPNRKHPAQARTVAPPSLLAVFSLILVSLSSSRAALPAETRDTAAQFVARNWQVSDGLPHNSVNAILQTRDGYLWLATSDGLARFDGLHFTVFGLRDGLPSLQVTCLFEDRAGALWIGTGLGLCRLQDGRFTIWNIEKGLAGNEVTSLAEDSEGNLWVGTVTGLSRGRDGKFTTLGKAEGLEDRRVRALVAKPGGGVWASMFYQGLLEWTGAAFANVPKPPWVSNAPPVCLLLDRQQNLWAGLARGFIWKKSGTNWQQFGRADGLPGNGVLNLAEDTEGNIWAALGNGGSVSLARDEEGARWQTAVADLDSSISVCPDREQNIWVGSRARGLTRLRNRKVSVLRIMRDEVEALPRSLAESSDGSLWVGTSSRGLFRVRSGVVDPFLREPPVQGFPYVSAVVNTRDDSVWWGAGPALFQWRSNSLASAYATEFRSWLREDRIRALCEDPTNGLWIGTQNGQLRLLRDGSFVAFTNAQPGAAINALLQSPDGSLLVGTYGKGVLVVRDGELVPEARIELPENVFVLALHRDADGVLWIGTEGGGLGRYENGRLAMITSRNGLINDTVVQILEDDSGQLWLGTFRGILRVSKSELKKIAEGKSSFVHPMILNQSDGAPSEQCMRGFHAALKTRDGRLHFSTDHGIVMVSPAQAWTNSLPPAVRFERMVVDGVAPHQRIQWTGDDEHRSDAAAPLRIAPGSRRLEFHYTGLSLSEPESVRFRYRIEGLDNQWIEAGLERKALYPLLPAGEYRFQVTACDNSGIWNEQGASLSFVVLPFFWQTWWFRVAALAGVIVLVTAVVRYASFRRLRRRLQMLEQETAVQKDRARIAKDLHDDLGANLSHIATLSELAQTDLAKPAQAREHIDQIFRTARTVTRSLDEIVWAVNPRNDSLDRFAAHLCAYAPEFLRTAGISCRLDVPIELPNTPLPSNVRHHLYLAFKESLHNVVKHAGATEAWVRLSLAADELTLVIEDNGRGFQSNDSGAPGEDGLTNLRQRMAEIGGRFEQRSEPGQGTRITLVAPFALVENQI